MGAAQSTRKITLVNDDKAGVIKLSESLAYRLRGQMEGQQAAAEVPGPAAAAEPLPTPFTPSEPSTPIPKIPETPKIPDIAPVPETAAPEPIASETIAPEPIAPEPIAQTPLTSEPPVHEPAAPEPVVSEPSAPESLVPEPTPAAPAAAETTPDTAEPPVIEAFETLPSLPLPLVVEEALLTEIAKELLVAAPPQGEQEVVLADTAEEPTVAPMSSPAAVEPASPDLGTAIKAGPGPTLSQPAGNIPPWSIYAEEAHLMVMRLREEKEQEIKKLNLNWRDKMDAREKEFTKMARLSEEEVGAALKDVEKLFLKASISPVCQNQQEAVLTCYQSHPRQSLRCARDVEQFTQCVNLSRLQSVMKQRAN